VPAQPWEDDRVRLAREHRVDILQVDAAARQLGPVGRFGHVRFGAEQIRGSYHCLFERQILERVQGVVMNEDADGALYRKQMRRMVDGLAQPVQSRLLRGIVLAQATASRRHLADAYSYSNIESCRDKLAT
jgi:hypothetical protein